METRRRVLLIALAACALNASACVSETAIVTRPNGADVVMVERGRALGKTPILLRDQAWVFTKHELEFTKPGYLPARRTLETNPRPLNIVLCAVCFAGVWPVWPIVMLGEFRRSEVIVSMEPTGDAFEDAFGELDRDASVSFEAVP